jgi:pyruvate/2-oxoglutarate dehydrogenase complex dihydrolipoamide acyltransferase (E2) component
MSRALAARKALNAPGGNLSVKDLLLYAAARALTENPRINAAFADGEMLIYERVNLGVAVDTREGLVVPVVHDAHQMALAELSDRVKQLAQKARAKKLAPVELDEGLDPVTSFIGSLCSCLLMSLRVAARVRKFDLAAASLSGRCTETGPVKLELRVSTLRT